MFARLINGTLMPCNLYGCVQTIIGAITWNRLVRYLKECMTFEDGDYLVEVQHTWGGTSLHGRCSASHTTLDTGGKGNEKTGKHNAGSKALHAQCELFAGPRP